MLAHLGWGAYGVGFGVGAFRADKVDVLQVAELAELRAGEAAVGEDELPVIDQVVVSLDEGSHHVAFVEFRVGQAHSTGMPSAVASRYWRMPQK